MKSEDVLNVTMNPENGISRRGLSYEEITRTVANHLINSRGSAKPEWRPYILQEGISYDGYCRDIRFDAKRFYPDSKAGDAVYTACNIFMEKDYELWINIIGCVQVFLNGKPLFSSWDKAIQSVEDDDYISLPVSLKKGAEHRLVIKSVCTGDSFGYRLNLSPPRCPSLWANFYLFLTRVQLPVRGLEKEEGIAVSPLYNSLATARETYEKRFEFETTPVYAFPKMKRESKTIDFREIYGEGKCAFAYTRAESDGFVEIAADSRAKILVNGREVYFLDCGESAKVELKKGDVLLVKSENSGTVWGFTEKDSRGIGLPMLDTERKGDFTFALCGPFYQEGFRTKLPPETAQNLLVPFPDGCGGKAFWRFQHAYLRAYLDSSFFGQWYYATMLSYLGVLRCGETLDAEQYEEYFLKNQRFLADWYDYVCYDSKTFGFAQFMSSACTEDALLDHIGTMGVNFIEAYRRTGEGAYLLIIERLREQIKHGVSRFPDGTFCRRASGTMWADDFYMSGPFLAMLYREMGDEDCLRDILQQVDGFCQRLYLPEEKIFSHIFFMDEREKNKIPWGRGNGWIVLSMSEILLQISNEVPAFEKIKRIFCEFCEGIAEVQDECGLWHQVLNRKESYLETSATAMFTLAFFRGVRNGWLPEKFIENASRGLAALLSRCVDKDGVVYGVCMGSSCSMDARYYFELPSVTDDNHGTGILLMLLCERILQERGKKKE